MAPKILRRCSFCSRIHAAYIVHDPVLGKAYLCYDCWKDWQAKHPSSPEQAPKTDSGTAEYG